MFTILINILFPYLTLDGRVGGEAQSSPADPILCDLHSHTITHYHIRRGWGYRALCSCSDTGVLCESTRFLMGSREREGSGGWSHTHYLVGGLQLTP